MNGNCLRYINHTIHPWPSQLHTSLHTQATRLTPLLRLHPRLQQIEGAQYPLQIVDRNSLFLSDILSHKMQEMHYLLQQLGVQTSVFYEHCLCHMKLQFPFVQMEYTIEKIGQMFSTRQQSQGLQESRQQHLACCYVSICGRLRWKQSEQSQ